MLRTPLWRFLCTLRHGGKSQLQPFAHMLFVAAIHTYNPAGQVRHNERGIVRGQVLAFKPGQERTLDLAN